MFNQSRRVLQALLILIFMSIAIVPTQTQNLDDYAPILVDNVTQLELVKRIGRGSISNIHYSPDGRMLAVSSRTGVWLYDATTLADVGFIENGIRAAWNPDSTQVAVFANIDNTVRVFDVPSGQTVETYRLSTSFVRALQFNRQGIYAISIEESDQLIHVWDVQSESIQRTITDIENHDSDVVFSSIAVNFSPDSTFFAVSLGRVVWVWNVNTGELVHSNIVNYYVRSVVFSPDSSEILAYTYDDRFNIWALGSKDRIHQSYSESNRGSNVAYSLNGAFIATVDEDKRFINIYDAVTLTVQYSLSVESAGNVVWSPDGQHITFTDRSSIYVWEVISQQLVQSSNKHSSNIRTIDWSADGRKILTGSWRGDVNIIDIETNATRTIEAHRDTVASVIWSADDTQFASASNDSIVRIWDAETGDMLMEHDTHDDEVIAVAWSPDNTLFASASTDETVQLRVSPTRHDPTFIMEHQKGTVSSLEFTADSTKLVGGAYDGNTYVWDIRTGGLVQRLMGPEESTYSILDIDVSMDSRYIAVGHTSGAVRLWDASTGTLLYSLDEPTQTFIDTVSFSINNQLLASSSRKYGVRLWDISTGQLLFSIEDTTDVTRVAFGPNGRFLAIADIGGSIELWAIPTS